MPGNPEWPLAPHVVEAIAAGRGAAQPKSARAPRDGGPLAPHVKQSIEKAMQAKMAEATGDRRAPQPAQYVLQRMNQQQQAPAPPNCQNQQGMQEIRTFLQNCGPPDQVLRRHAAGCYALFWANPGLTGNPNHIVVDIHYALQGGSYVFGNCFVQGWEGALNLNPPLRRGWVSRHVPPPDPHHPWPANPHGVITGGWGPQIPENTNWQVREN